MAENLAPNFPVEDFLRYYGGTHVRYRGEAMWVHPHMDPNGNVQLCGLGKEDQARANVPVQELLHWDNLRWPELGWVDFAGSPWYVVRVPKRDVAKGIGPNNCTATVPPYMARILKVTGAPVVHRRVTETSDFWGAVFNEKSMPLGEAVQQVLSGRSLYAVVNRRVAVMVNGDKDTAQEFPAVVFVKNLLAARVDEEGRLHQLGEIDVSEAIE